MKRILFIALLINVTKSDTDNTKNDSLKESVTKYTSDEFGSGKNRVFLNDVVSGLRSQDWSAEEEPCLNQTLLLVTSLQNFTLWAVWTWDSISEPKGLLYGSGYQLGNFDECMNPPWHPIYQDPKTKYCLADIVLERTQKSTLKKNDINFGPYQSALDFFEYRAPYGRPLNEMTWGVCVPAVCGPSSIKRLLAQFLGRSHLGVAGFEPHINVVESCQSPSDVKNFDGAFYAFIILIGLLIVIALVCTYLHDTRTSRRSKLQTNICKAFSLKENAKDFLKMNKENGVDTFYGIRFISICSIVLAHQVGMFNSGAVSDGLQSDQDYISAVRSMFIIHDDLFVDTFFLMSAFLTATALIKMKSINPFLLILKRYVRLTVALALVIFYWCTVFPFTGSGPLWQRAIAGESETCRKNWWLNLLMISNYIDTQNMCMVVSWYIPSDFHFFIIAVFIYWIYKRVSWLGLLCTGVLSVASVLVPGIINYVYKFPAIQLFTYEFLKNPRNSEQFKVAYIKSHNRFAAYLVGFFAGYFFETYRTSTNFKRMSRRWSVLGTILGLAIMLVVIGSGHIFLLRSRPLEDAVYAALNRPAWAIGVTLIVLCCSLGDVPFIKDFLSWYVWVPLSRLAYGLYLWHSVFIIRQVFTTRNPQHNDSWEHLLQAMGTIMCGIVFAFAIWILAEAPINKLLTMALTRDNKVAPGTSNDEHKGNGHLHVNMSPVETICSKI